MSSQIKQIKDAIDIVELIGQRVELKQSGQNFKGLCPFHGEKSPSFFVNPLLQRYRCFGCSEAGDVFTFLEKYEGMSFGESLKMLADQAGVTLADYRPSPEDDQRERLVAILDLTRAYYHYLLTEHAAGAPAREYLKQRGVTSESIKLFQLGFAMPGWDGLIKYLHHKKNYTLDDLEKAGLVISKAPGRYYDRFRGRIMFPLTNPRGQVVGFSGRVLEKDAKEAKYINTPETMLYHKSELLFGYSQLYQEIRKAESVIVVEGELDVISSAQAHVNNVVAIKGSALTRDQLRLLQRTVKKVLLSLDMDDAGVEATKRAIGLAKEFELELRVLQLPSGKDPDELARTQPKVWRETMHQSVSVYQFFLDKAMADFDVETPEGKRQVIDAVAPIFGEISHAVERDFYVKKLAEMLQVKLDVVESDLKRFRVKGKATPKPKTEEKKEQKPLTRRARLEAYLVFLTLQALQRPDTNLKTLMEPLVGVSFTLPAMNALVDHWQTLRESTPEVTGPALVRSLAGDWQQQLSDLAIEPEFTSALEQAEWQTEWHQTLEQVRQGAVSDQIKEITRQLDELDGITDKTPEQEQKQEELLTEVVRLQAHKKAKA